MPSHDPADDQGTHADGPANDPRAERAARFAADTADDPLTPPLLVAGVLLLAWWALLGVQAARWWPHADSPTQVAAGRAQVDRDVEGAVTALVVGKGAGAVRFGCARPRPTVLVLHVPLLRCEDAGHVLVAAGGHEVRVAYDRPQVGGRTFPRMLDLVADGRPLWTRDDSLAAFSWQLWRAAFAGVLLLVPGWFLHRRWLRRA